MRYGLRTRSAKVWLVATLVIVLAALAAGCAKPAPTATPRPAATPTPTTARIATPTPTVAAPTPQPTPGLRLAEGTVPWADRQAKRGGTLRVATQVFQHFDPVQMDANNQMSAVFGPRMDNLVRRHESTPGVLVPDLATRWEVSSDGTVYVFRLRPGVKFHDGTPFGAKDVVAHFRRVIWPPSNIAGPRTGWFEPVKSVDLVDDLTVRFTLKFPFGSLLDYLASGQAGGIIGGEDTLKKYDSDLRKVANWPGTGPFKYVRNVQDQLWVYERNREYWNGDLPLLDRVEVYVFPSHPPTAAALVAGQLDFIRLATSPAWQATEGSPNFIRAFTGGGHTWYLYMNPDKPPFNDLRVRQALDLLMDRNAMRQTMLTGNPGVSVFDAWVPVDSAWGEAVVGDSWKQRPTLATDQQGREAAVAKAKQLLQEAGYSKGLGTIQVLYRIPGGTYFTFMGDMLEAQLNKYIGPTKFSYQGLDHVVINKRLLDGDYEISLELYNIAEIDHPVQWLAETWRDQGSLNMARYNSREFNALAARLKEAQDKATIVSLSRQMVDILYRDVPAIAAPWPRLGCIYGIYVKNVFCGNTPPGSYFSNYMRQDTVWLDK